MPVQIRGNSDSVVDQVAACLKPFVDTHPKAVVEVYRQNQVSVRVRVIDPSFATMNRPERSRQVWPLLRTLPDEVLSEISFVILVPPEEKLTSMSSREFDDPIPSRF